MLKKMLLVTVGVLLAITPIPALAATETIELVGLSQCWSPSCDQPLGCRSFLEAGSPSAVAVNPASGDCWYGAYWVRCCDGYEWYSEMTNWVIVEFPPLSERIGWCGPCELPPPPPPIERCADILMPRFLSRADPDYRRPAALAVNPSDGSLWVAEPAQILHLNSSGDVIWQDADYANPRSISVNRVDGSCWVANTENHEVLRISSSGSILWRVGGFNLPMSVSVNPTDGTAWVADNASAQVVHVASNGSELWRGGGFTYPVAVAVNEADGSCWVADKHANAVVHLNSQGTELRRVNLSTPRTLAVNPKHGDVWVIAGSQLVHLDPDGTTRASAVGPSGAGQLSVYLAQDTVWVSDEEGDRISHLAPVCSPFADVDCWHWALHETVACYDANLVRGYQAQTLGGCDIYEYRPQYMVTRDQMAVYIARALAGGDAYVPPGPTTPSFTDVWYSYWAYKYIEYICQLDVARGYEDGAYRPDTPVDRGQMAVYIARSVVDPTGEEGLAGYVAPEEPTFPDTPTDFWSYKHVEYCVENDIVRGYLDGKYHPEAPVTRGQMAVYICRAFNLPIS
jgi:hypothetical protein